MSCKVCYKSWKNQSYLNYFWLYHLNPFFKFVCFCLIIAMNVFYNSFFLNNFVVVAGNIYTDLPIAIPRIPRIAIWLHNWEWHSNELKGKWNSWIMKKIWKFRPSKTYLGDYLTFVRQIIKSWWFFHKNSV